MIINEPEIAATAINTVKKLWGVEYWIVNTDLYCLKYLKINPGFQSSIHAHKNKDETFIGISGTVQVLFHDSKGNVSEGIAIDTGQMVRMMPKQFHSFSASNLSWIMEISTHHNDKDVIRLQESMAL